MKRTLLASFAATLLLTNSGFAQGVPTKPATEATKAANEKILQELPFSDKQDFEDASRGFIAAVPGGAVKSGNRTNWDLQSYDFLKSEAAPDTVNPSLWRIGRLNMNNGLFKVTDRVYQLRGFDLSNMTVIEGDTGLILIDPLVTIEAAKAALDLYYQHRPRNPVVAVIYTHSHADHYGGVKGVVDEADVRAGKVAVLAPEGFLKEAVSENVYAGNAMGRRTLYQYGAFLPRGPRGQIDAGLGKTTSLGEASLIAPTDTVKQTGDARTIDGVQMEFQMAPGTEAPAEMLIYFPQFRMLNAAEDATHTLHNLYTLRGAQVRDAVNWWKTLNTAIERYGDKTDVVIAQHHWPTWDQPRVVSFLESQRDMFKYIHDQSLRLANHGLKMNEIAEQIELPKGISNHWANRGYYGSVNHNAKAIYQRYLGWYDSNPAHLWPLPEAESSRRYVEYMGGADAVIAKARQAFDKGEYRWVAEIMNKIIYGDPNNKAARDLGADALEQLGYQQENPTWRNEFLMGAFELRSGVPNVPGIVTASPDVVAAMSPDMILDFMGIRLNGPKADGKSLRFNWKVSENDPGYGVELRNGVLIYTEGKTLPNADAVLTMSKPAFAAALMGASTFDKEVAAGRAKVDGSAAKVAELFGLLDNFNTMFAIVTPAVQSAETTGNR